MSDPVYIEPSRRVLFHTVTIPAGLSLSNEFPLRGYQLKGLILPAAWTLADITFQAARPVQPSQQPSGVEPTGSAEFLDVYLDNEQVATVDVVGSSRYIVLSAYVGTANRGIAEALAGVDLIKIRSGTPATPVNQAAERIVTLILGASTR